MIDQKKLSVVERHELILLRNELKNLKYYFRHCYNSTNEIEFKLNNLFDVAIKEESTEQSLFAKNKEMQVLKKSDILYLNLEDIKYKTFELTKNDN